MKPLAFTYTEHLHKRREASPEHLFLKEAEAREALGVGVKVFRQILRSGELPYTYLGKRRRFAPEDLEAFKNMRRDRWLKVVRGTRTKA